MRRWLFPTLIVLAALVAHGGCLRSTFYLDDWTQIVDNDGVEGGQWWAYHQRALPYFTYWLTFRCFGLSAPAFHAGNLLLHAGVALAVFGFARDFFATTAGLPPDRARRIGAWAGLLFAVHPLCSEIPNYVRARDLAFVTLFTVLMARAVLRWRRGGGWPWLAAAVAAGLAATFSKEVGIVIAGGTAALLWFGVSPAERRQPPGKWWHPGLLTFPVPLAFFMIGLLGLLAALAWSGAVIPYLWPLGHTVSSALHSPLLGWNLLTQARILWLYAWRVFLPVRLCSDHQIAWTMSTADGIAWLAAAVLVSVLVLTASLWFRARTRPLALLLTLAWLAILHRLANVSNELMVEYRVYPAMAFLCPALAWGLDRGLSRPACAAARPWVLATLVAVGAVLSILRTRDWRTPETLAANIVAQYPLQARAWQEVQEADLRANRWPSVVARQDDIRRALDGQETFNRSQPLRHYDYNLEVFARVCTEGNYALALANTRDEWAAFDHLAWLTQALHNHHISDPVYTAMILYARGMIYETVGPEESAVTALRESDKLAPFLLVSHRELQRIEARRKKESSP